MSKKNKGIHVYFDKEKNYWEVREFINGKRKRHATGLSCLDDAERKREEILAQNAKFGQCSSLGKS